MKKALLLVMPVALLAQPGVSASGQECGDSV
jgi:hypothetical protein